MYFLKMDQLAMARPRPRVMPDLKGWIVQPMHTDVIVCNSIFKKKKKIEE
jgi:hypothetical protein